MQNLKRFVLNFDFVEPKVRKLSEKEKKGMEKELKGLERTILIVNDIRPFNFQTVKDRDNSPITSL